MEQTVNPFFSIPDIETKSHEEISKFQNLELQKLLLYLSNNSEFYQKHFKLHNIAISDITCMEDLAKIPAISKDHLQAYNSQFLCVPQHKIIDYVTTSGTTSEPVTFALSDKDLNRLAYNEAISLVCADGNPNDIYQLTTTIDRRFMAGLAYFLGIRDLGCGIVRVGSGIPQLQLDTIERIKPNTIIAVPSFIVALINYANSIGFDLNNCSVKKVICIGEPIRDELFKPNALHIKITNGWDVKLYSTYASTEMSTAYTECVEQAGGHEHPELIISELLDEDDKVIVDPDIPGELCITTLGVEGMPLLRFKTGDIVKFEDCKCACGRNTKRISPVIGRKNQMIKYKGTTLYPPAVFDVLNSISEIKDYVIELKHNELKTDEVIIYLSAITTDVNMLLDQTTNLLQAKLRVKPKVFIISSKEIQAMQVKANARKPIKFIDNRKS
jgi:phenylacetate-CoA ligase